MIIVNLYAQECTFRHDKIFIDYLLYMHMYTNDINTDIDKDCCLVSVCSPAAKTCEDCLGHAEVHCYTRKIYCRSLQYCIPSFIFGVLILPWQCPALIDIELETPDMYRNLLNLNVCLY